jgi:MFS family permease
MDHEENIPKHRVANLLTPNFLLGFLAFLLFAAANLSLTPTLPIFLARLGSHEGEIGVLVGVFGLSSLMSRFLVGRYLVKYSEKSAMMMGALLFALTSLAFIVIRPFWPFFAVRFLQGVAFASLDTAAFAFIVNVIPPAYRGQGLAYFMLAPNLALAVAPACGMFLINRYSFAVLFLICVGLSVGTFFLSYLLKGKKETVRPDKIASVPRGLFFDAKIVAPAMTGFLHTFASGALVAFFPLYAIQCGVANPGLFFSAVAIMIIAGRALGGRILDSCSKDKVVVAFLAIAMIAMVMLSFSKTLPMFIIVGLFWGTGISFFAPATMAYAFEYAGSADGTAVGTFRALTDSGVALGPMVMGALVPMTGYPGMFLCLALICLIDLGYFQFYVRRRDTMATAA